MQLNFSALILIVTDQNLSEQRSIRDLDIDILEMAGGDGGGEYERTLEETATWAVAVVCFVLLAISISIEHIIHVTGKWFKKKHKIALYEALEKVKGELMLMGFISFMLTLLQKLISTTCISREVASTWRPCPSYKGQPKQAEGGDHSRKLLEYSQRRFLATKGYDQCGQDKVAFMSAYGIHQLHIFIFVLAIFHILQCIITLGLGRTKMRKWKKWENETKTLEYRFNNDPERFRFTRDTTFGRKHLNIWSQSSISLWIASLFRQFHGSVSKADYLTLRRGFIMAHLPPGSEASFDFRKYIQRSLDEDFKVVVGISPIIWFFAVLFLLTNTNGWYSHLWLPFIPLIIILLVGAKLQMIISKMGLKIQERGVVVKGGPVVEPGDHLFWFNRPRLLLNLIHFVLFQNAFQLAFFAWSALAFGFRSCFHRTTLDIVIKLTIGILVQVLCSYVTLPLYALVTQMGSTMKPTIFNDRVATALKNWHQMAKKHVKDSSKHSKANTPLSSAPTSPIHGLSPVHLLHGHHGPRSDSVSAPTSPMASRRENYHWDVEEGAPYPTMQRHEIQMMPSHHHVASTQSSSLHKPHDNDRDFR